MNEEQKKILIESCKFKVKCFNKDSYDCLYCKGESNRILGM